jgi:hypothetical protein
MDTLVSRIAEKVGVSEAQARGGAALLLKAARDKLGATQFDQSIGTLPGMAALLDSAPRAGGVGRLFGGLASAVGGDRAALVAAIVGGFNKLGMKPQLAEAFVPVIVEHLRANLDPSTAQRIEQLLRA